MINIIEQSCKKDFILATIYTLIMSACDLSGPMLLGLILEYLESTTEPKSTVAPYLIII